jgi:hypothetical protein
MTSAPKQVTRARKLKFIRDRGRLLDAIASAFLRNGPDWLTEDQLNEIVFDEIERQRSAQKRNRKNRRVA